MPACSTLSHDTNLTEVLAYLWMAPDHACQAEDVNPRVLEGLLELGEVENREGRLLLTDKGLRQGKFWHEKFPDPPHWMLDTTPAEEGGTGLFHAFENYAAAYTQKPVLCGLDLLEATDYVIPALETQKCPGCRRVIEDRGVRSP